MSGKVTVTNEVTQETVAVATPGPTGPTGPQGETGPTGADGTNGEGVPTGGTEGQTLTKASATDYDTEWTDPPTAADSATGSTKEVWATENIAAGDLVAITGAAGAYSAAGIADKDSSTNVAGIATTAIPAATVGTIQVGGTIQEAFINTLGFTAGDPLWLGEAGAYTNVIPNGVSAVIRIGIVGVVAASNGSLVLDMPSFGVKAAESLYDNTDSDLAATNVQDAIDELAAAVAALS